MADTTAGLMITSSVLILMLSTVGAEKLRHDRSSPLHELHRRFTYPHSELKKHSYHTVDENNYSRRHPNLFRVRNRVIQPKTTTTTSSAVAAVIMLPWLLTTEDPFRMDRNGTLDDGAMPEMTVKSVESLEWDNGIDNEWDVFNKKQAAFTSTTVVTPSTHHHHHHATAKTTTLAHQRVPEIPVKPKIEDLKARRMEEQKVMEHITRVTREAKCKLPRPKVIRVSDVHPHSARKYIPHCTVIHQCGGDTGCCDDERKVCSAAKSERVHLSFYILSGKNKSLERLEFLNHTECHCQLRKERLLQDSTLQPTKQTLPVAPLCACPSKYSVRHLSDGTCMCDCFHLDKTCLKLKKGKAYFPTKDVKCIQNGTCLLPSCEYGHYLQKSHRCVERAEMFSHWPKFTVQDIDS